MKRILLVADQPGWIFERHCMELKKRLTEYHIDVAYHRQNIPKMSNDYDCVYICDPMPMAYPPASKTIMGLRCEFLYREHPQGAQGLYENGFPGRCVSIKDKCAIFHVVNKNQYNVFENIVTDKPLLIAQHGVDEKIFDRDRYPREKHDGIIVSIAGRGSSNKGFEIIRQVCDHLGIKYLTASYKGKKLSKEEMPLFYNEVDAHICMSKTEGLNNPIMEAGAMGLPVISTRCGAAEEIIKDGENGFLIDRNEESLKKALVKLANENSCLEMGDKMYNEIINNWTWEKKIEDFRKMFELYFNTQ